MLTVLEEMVGRPVNTRAGVRHCLRVGLTMHACREGSLPSSRAGFVYGSSRLAMSRAESSSRAASMSHGGMPRRLLVAARARSRSRVNMRT